MPVNTRTQTQKIKPKNKTQFISNNQTQNQPRNLKKNPAKPQTQTQNLKPRKTQPNSAH